jgi:hypothetical protein
MKKLAAAFVVCLFAAATQAAPVVIDFEEFNLGDSAGGGATGNQWPPLQSQGFSVSGFLVFDPAEIVTGTNTGTKAFGGTVSGFGQDGFGVASQVSMQRSDGGAFALYSLDLLLQADPNGITRVSGLLAGGGSANLGVPTGTGDWLNLEAVFFSAEGNQFGFGSATVELDNVVVSAVPIPAAVWLFGSALAGLGWLRRKQTI